jgi:hypothetical protein
VLLQQPVKNAVHVLLWFRIHAHARQSSRVLSSSHKFRIRMSNLLRSKENREEKKRMGKE